MPSLQNCNANHFLQFFSSLILSMVSGKTHLCGQNGFVGLDIGAHDMCGYFCVLY